MSMSIETAFFHWSPHDMNTLFVALTVTVLGAPIASEDVKRQNTIFKDLWETDFIWKFDSLPEKGGVDEARVPYSGYIYPDRQGGTRSLPTPIQRLRCRW